MAEPIAVGDRVKRPGDDRVGTVRRVTIRIGTPVATVYCVEDDDGNHFYDAAVVDLSRAP